LFFNLAELPACQAGEMNKARDMVLAKNLRAFEPTDTNRGGGGGGGN
jgi:hypothetical protein